jgi:hypothetical protein
LEICQNSEPNPPCVISASYISELPCSELAGIVKTLKNSKNKNLKDKKCEKFKNKK